MLLRDLKISLEQPQTALAQVRATLVGLSPGSAQALRRTGEFGDDVLVRHIVGLDPKLPPAEAKRKLREIFARYNSMLTTERDPFKRQRYQDCIDAVARLRKKHG